MTFPATKLIITFELWIDGAWVDLTSDVQQRETITITRGRPDESSSASPTSMRLTLDNTSGKYSIRNPMSTYFGKIGRNTQCRLKVDASVRFIGDVVAWTAKQDTSGNDSYVELEAAGILRRLSQGTRTLQTALKDYYLNTTPVQYWPCTDGVTATKCLRAKGTSSNSSLYEVTSADVVNHYGTGILSESQTPVLRIDDTRGGYMTGICDGTSANPDASAFDFMYRPDPEIAEGLNMAGLAVGLFANPGDEFRVTLEAAGGAITFTPTVGGVAGTTTSTTPGAVPYDDGNAHHIRVQLTQVGADVTHAVYFDGVAVASLAGTIVGYTLTGPWQIYVLCDRVPGEDLVAFGHLAVFEDGGLNYIPDITETATAAAGYAGELAGYRFLRLGDEIGAGVTVSGVVADSAAMGLQYEDYYQNQILEIEATDRGMLYEERTGGTLGYRTRTYLYSQTPVLTINYANHELSQPFEPVEDDQYIRNDVFAQRREGGSFQATKETGPMSVLDPPDGVGRYKDEVQLNCEADEQLDDLAAWLLAVGTVDEARFPRITVDRANPHVVANPTLSAALMDVAMGDKILITNATGADIYADISLLVFGLTETINTFEHTFTFVGVPSAPYDVAEYGSTVGLGPDRFDTEGSTVATAVNSTATTLSVRSDETPWTTNVSEVPFDINVAGERMTVTGITGGAPSFVGVGTSATANNASVTPGLPAGVAVGDLVLILASIRNSGTGTVNSPTNWFIHAGSSSFMLASRVYDGVWTMPTITFTGGVLNADTIAQSCAFRNTTGVDSLTGSAVNGSAQDIGTTGPSCNPDERLGVHLITGWKQDDWTSVATLADYTEIGEQVATAGDDAGQVWDYWINRRTAHTGDDFIVTGGAAAISRYNVTFLPRAPQTFTVTRSVNQVVKSHVVGAEVRLWKTPRYGF